MSSSLSLSFELVFLMNWLLKNEKAMLGDLIKHAIKHGFDKDVKQLESIDFSQISDQFYYTILDFLLFLEEALEKDLKKEKLDKQAEKAILPVIKKIQNESLSDDTIKTSLQQTKAYLINVVKNNSNSTCENNGEKSVKDVLFENVLKNWKPTNSEQMH